MADSFVTYRSVIWLPMVLGLLSGLVAPSLPLLSAELGQPLSQKQLPSDRSFTGLFGPNDRHRYFEHAALVPFRPNAKKFHKSNAWWLAESAMLVYVDDVDFLGKQLQTAGLRYLRTFHSPESSVWDTQAWVAHNDRYAIVSLRGTDPFELKDIVTDLNLLQTQSEHRGRIHSGFNAGLDDIWKELRPHLEMLANQGRTIWFTGHSLGGALAVLAADRFGRAAGVYTFGCPRVGDATFAKQYSQPTYRFVNNLDVVTDLPPPILYHHVGELKYFGRHCGLQENVKPTQVLRDRVETQMEGVSEFLSKMSELKYRLTLPKGVKDHAPIDYVTHCWNALVEDQR